MSNGIGPDDLPSEVKALLGTPCTEEPCAQCNPHPNLTCQLSRDSKSVVWVPAQVVNADAGHLIMVPSSGSGPIGALLAALEPAQHYTHEGIMTKDRVEIRHCTSSETYLKHHPYSTGGGGTLIDKNPTEGFTEDAVRFGWPGTVTQSIDQAYRASRDQTDEVHVDYVDGNSQLSTGIPASTKESSARRIAHPTGDPLPIKGMEFDPVMVPVALPADAEALLDAILAGQSDPSDLVAITRNANVTWQMMWPLVVKPCPHNSPPHIVDALRRVAEAAAYLHAHYRFFAYIDATIGENSKYNGPYMNDPDRPVPGKPCDPSRHWDHSVALVSSVFLWEAVREANRQIPPPRWEAGTLVVTPEIFLTHPLDHEPGHNCSPFYAPAGVDRPNMAWDGLFDYSSRQTARAGISLAAAIERSIVEEESTLPYWLSWLGDVYEGFSDIQDDVTNQLCNAFAFDNCDPTLAKDNDDWRQNPPSATSVSPDNIIRSWMAPLSTQRGTEIHGLYGYNEQLVFRPGHYETRPSKIWAFSPGPTTVYGLVKYNDAPAVGARVTLACQTTYTNADGAYQLEICAGRYLLEGMLYLPQPAPQPAWCAEGRLEVDAPIGLPAPLPDLILHDPPGENRIVQISGRADLVNRHTFGKDWWDHPPMDFKQIHLGSYHTAEGNENTSNWGSTIDSSYGVGVEVKASRAVGPPSDPYPVNAHLHAILGSKGIAGWPFTPDATADVDVEVPTQGTKNVTIDLKTGAVAPVRAHLAMTVANYRQG